MFESIPQCKNSVMSFTSNKANKKTQVECSMFGFSEITKTIVFILFHQVLF